MPDNPDPNIEDLLKAYAAKRRQEAGPPMELPPARRRRLREEVARHFRPPQAKRGQWIELWNLFWPRLGFALGTFVVLAALVWGLNQKRSDPLQMAKQTAPPVPDDKRQLAEERLNEVEKDSLVKSKEMRETLSLDRVLPPPAEPKSEPASPSIVSSPPPKALAFRSVAPYRPPEPSPRPTLTDAAAADVGDSLAIAGVYQVVPPAAEPSPAPIAGGRAGAQVLAESLRADKKLSSPSPMPPQVLQNFSLEQTGNRIRIVESDGSVYEGSAKELPPSSVSIEVQGTNQTLQALVNFTGTLGMDSSQALVLDTQAAAGTVRLVIQPEEATPLPALQSAPVLLHQTQQQGLGGAAVAQSNAATGNQFSFGTTQSLLLRGRARIGLTNEWEIQAVRLRP